MITPVCWMDGWLIPLVRSFALCDLSKTTSLIFVKFGTDVRHMC